MNARRVALYASLVAAFVVAAGIGAVTGDNPNPRLAFICALFAVCALPVLIVDRLNGRYTMLCVYLPVYFVSFGLSDTLALFLRGAPDTSSPVESLAELAILAGAVLSLSGYLLMVRRTQTLREPKEWSPWAVIVGGALVWMLGMVATWIWQVEILNKAWASLKDLNVAAAMLVTAGMMLHPVGVALLAYGCIKSRSRVFHGVMLLIVLLEFVVGFIEDSKEIAMQPALIVLIAKLLIDGKLPKTWVAVGALVALLSFPVFQAYRAEVLAERGVSRAAAALDIAKNLEIALQSQSSNREKALEYSSFSFLSRISYKPIIELVIERTGSVGPYQRGYTLLPLFLVQFVPRIFWPDKPDASVGQYFNRELHITDTRENYISVTLLGEFYWNFGWIGVIAGSFSLGAFLGWVNRRFNLAEHITVTRFLVFAVTTYTFCVRQESSLALAGIVWVRTLLFIGVLHVLLARAGAARRETPVTSRALPDTALPFPNLLR